MRAAFYRAFAEPFGIERLPDPTPPPHGVVLAVRATGVCRSDWHGWQGHDSDIRLPHVPGHELAGVVAAVGADVTRWAVGDRVTVPFVCGCGRCPQCVAGNQHICDQQAQPGFTYWGAFAEYVAIHHADVNLVRLPDSLDFVTAASLGCRFATAFRAIVDQAQVVAGAWVAVHGCGGVGLSAIMIARALGANVVAIDVTDAKLAFARSIGATATINARDTADVVAAVRDVTGGGAHASLDALGSRETCVNSIANLRKRGTHLQVGLLLGDQSQPPVPMALVIANELRVVGSHGMQAHRYAAMLRMIAAGMLDPARLVGHSITLDAAPDALMTLPAYTGTGVIVIAQDVAA